MAQEPQDSWKRAVREAKNRRYDVRESFLRRLTDLPPGHAIGGGHGDYYPPIPTSDSDVIIVGTVKSIQPYLSESETNLYTEFTASVEEAIKNSTATALAISGQVIFDQVGGALRLPNGRIARLTPSGRKEMPSVDRRYLLFLKSTHEGQDLLMVRGYELHDNRVFPLGLTIGEVNPYGGAEEDAFLSEIRTAVAKK